MPMNFIRDLGRSFDRNVIQPAAQPFRKAGSWIEDRVTKPVSQAVGLRDTPVPDHARPRVDPQRAEAMADYGQQLQQQGQQFNPAQFGGNYFQPRTANMSHHRPGIYSPQQRAPQAPGMMQTPQMQNVGGQNLQLRDPSTGTGTNIFQEQRVLRDQMHGMATPQDMVAGFNPELRQTYIDMATSGLEQQKQDAMKQLEEKQRAAGNFGSSVGQKQMMGLQKEYDRQISQAGREADLMQMEAEREDRYRNIGVDMSRTGMAANLAGQSAGLDMSAAGYRRDTANMQNQVEMIKQDFARQGIQIDNNTAMQMAQFGAGQQQQDFANRMAGAEFNRAGDMAAYQSEWDRYRDMTAQADKRGQSQETADVRNYGAFQDYLNNLARYGSNQIDPTSELNFMLWQQQQQDRRDRFGNVVSLAGMFL